MNAIPESTAAIKQALQDPSTKSDAVRMLAELSELRDGRDSALEMFQYIVDSDGNEPQVWIVGYERAFHSVLLGVSSRSWIVGFVSEGGC